MPSATRRVARLLATSFVVLVTTCFLFAGSAKAQTASSWQFLPGSVLSPQPLIPWASQSVGSPSVAYDSIRDRFIMVFEARTPTVDARCPQGVWALGLATSSNGFSWSVSTLPIALPNPGNGTYFSCVAAHPAAVFVDNGVNGTVQVYFKAEQDTDACVGPAPSWGCGSYTGIGRLRINLNAAGDPIGTVVQGTPVLNNGDVMGYPKVVKDGPDFILALQDYPDIVLTQSTSFSSFPNPTPVITVAAYAPVVPWVEDEFFNPAMNCDDSVAFPFAMFVGGRDTFFATIVDGAMSKAIASNPLLWALSTTTQVEWTGNDEWRHWDIQRLITGDYLVWFSEKDVNGDNFIRFGGTTLTFNNSDTQGKVCP
jgi:hypothetical protein